MSMHHYLPSHPREWFSMAGRVNRLKFLVTQILLAAVGLAVVAVLPDRGVAEDICAPIGFVVLMTLMVLMAFNIVKRFHDLDRSGVNYWLLLFVPFLNIYLAFLLFFVKGTDEENQYGSNPLLNGVTVQNE